VIVGAALGIVVVSALWWLYFDVAAIFARGRLMQAQGLELHRLALHAYSYLHLPMVAGIVLFALGFKTTLSHVGQALDTVPAAVAIPALAALPSSAPSARWSWRTRRSAVANSGSSSAPELTT
jgi:low temperature requirement protein LtrA